MFTNNCYSTTYLKIYLLIIFNAFGTLHTQSVCNVLKKHKLCFTQLREQIKS